MSQLASAARPAKTAKALRQIKEIRKVKGAIRWHERAREKRKKIAQERFQTKRAFGSRLKWHKDNVVAPIKEAKKNLWEDYMLGPLRPNRAVGPGADKYGALYSEQMRRPPIPVDVQKRRNEARIAKGFDPVYPLVVDDKKFFPIAVDDRVMVMYGREQGKIGVVGEILEESHEIIVKDINKHYVDGDIFNAPPGEESPTKRETEVPFALEHLRLVIPYRMTTKDEDGNDVRIWRDVVVDNIVMERHTTGVDPFTGIDYGNHEFPEEHRFDPSSGLPIFNRYIAGTRRRIQWPWETVLPEFAQNETPQSSPESNESWIGKVKSPIKTTKAAVKSLTSKIRKPKEEEAEVKTPQLTEEDKELQRIQAKLDQLEEVPKLPRGPDPRLPADFDDDTGRNKAEPLEGTSSFYPTLVYPPFPPQLTPELQEHSKEVEEAERSEKQDWYEDKKEVTTEEKAARKAAKAERLKKKTVPESMKTPLQLRWEAERRKKLQAAEATKVDREALMIALEGHIAKKRAARGLPPAPTAELD
ncbi:hypothetical protein BU23DRAFT_502766 [Bimuria novae-zelandiae CBS 107.79]|uniref:KOW domain-containing protein n=1 Tax=Bimuria novae-zelandiae CBS 107.79 TaxID=1447943 RepID=A0A6A5VGD8_9PLEO|nr:hypothetical protein BU23DRAFT_502766 [Bimuria novae-zelandiae CBS 107.79]